MTEQKAPWWRSSLIYQIYPRSFQDTNADGIGDLPGIIERLDYLNDGTSNSLRAGGIWLTPVYPSPNFDWGYDVADYVAIHPDLGTLDDFDRLVAEAGKRGIKVVMDLVANHSSDLHDWFQESRSSRDNPKRDWYIWKDRPAHGGYPNNWASVFGGGSAWEWDEATEQFYFHAFLKQQPDLNWQNPELREAIWDVMRFWMKRGVAGFRLDAIAHVGKRPDFPDNPLLPHVPADAPIDWNTQLHEYDLADPVMHPWLQEMRRVADEFGAMLVGEIYSLRPETLARFAADDELHSVFNFDLLLSPWSASGFKSAAEAFERDGVGSVWPSPVLDNHDNSRSFTRHDSPGEGTRRAAVAAIMLLTQRGTPFVYYGQEIGMHDVEVPRAQLKDPVGVVGWPSEPGRDKERTSMQWTAGPKGGFTTGAPWLPVSQDSAEVNVEVQAEDDGSLLGVFRRLGAMRAEHPAVAEGSYRVVESGQEGVWSYLREGEREALVIVLNFNSDETSVDLSAAGQSARLLVASDPETPGDGDLAHIRLPALSGAVYLVGN